MVGTLNLQAENLVNKTEDLVARVKQGDHAAFHLIFERHHRIVLGFLYGMVNNYSLAEELAQETFIGAYKNIGSLKDETKLVTWLCGIAKNVAYNFFRTRRTTHEMIEISDQIRLTLQSREALPDSQLLVNELNTVIQNALQQLDEDKRTVFILKMIQQLSYTEITEITGFSIPKLKTDLHRAKIEIRQLIRPYMEGEL